MELTDLVAIPDDINVLREKLGVTQRAMATLLGVTERTLNTLEAGGELSPAAQRRVTERLPF
jgi:DNA-binding XRE family transcriptional regulator